MRLLVDATMVKQGQAGIRSFALNLVRALAGIEQIELSVVVARANDDDWGGAQVVRSSLSRQGVVPRLAWRAHAIPRLVRHRAVDALLVAAPEAVHAPHVTQGMIIHDLGPLMAPGIYGSRRYASYAAMMGHYVNKVDVVFTPSEATKLDVLRWFGVGTVHPVVAGPILHEGQPTHQERGNKSGADFALYVGALLPHKNVQPVIEAFGRTSKQRSAMPDRLVIVGPRYGGEVARALSGAGPSVEHRGFVSDDELDHLYRSARVVVFPSLFEGFGLPMMEALARGTAVLASDIPALREVGGLRAAYVSRPTDPQAWAEALALGVTVRPTASVMSWHECAQAVFEGLRHARTPGNGRGPLS